MPKDYEAIKTPIRSGADAQIPGRQTKFSLGEPGLLPWKSTIQYNTTQQEELTDY